MDSDVKQLLRESWSDTFIDKWRGFLYYATNLRFLYSSQLAPLIAAAIVDSAARGTISSTWLRLAALLALGEVFSSFLGFVSRGTTNRLWEKLQVIRYARYTEQSFGITYHQLVNTNKGSIASKVQKKADFIIQFMTFSSDAMRTLVSLIVSFFVLYSRYQPLAWAYLGIWVPLVLVFYRVATARVEVNKLANEAWDVFSGEFSDTISNVDTVKQFANEKIETQRIFTVGKKQFAEYAKRWWAGARQQNTFSIFETSLNVAFGLFGLYALSRGNISIGTYVLVAAYIRNTINDANGVSNVIRNFNEETVRGVSLDKLEYELPHTPTKHLSKSLKASSISFSDFNFSYKDGKQDVLKDFQLEIKKGEKVGIVGRSGSGKTTITKLLLGLYKADSGDILFDGKGLSELGDAQVRDIIAYVPQEPSLFHRSIRENITYGNPNASTIDINRALRLSYVKEFTDTLPQGLDTLVGDRGIKLSGGQKQRVAIARAILKNAPILLFDEATSALDSESESVIQKAMSNIMKNKTTIVIAHRLSTLRHMDRIIVMDEGKIIEDGSHDELVNRQNGLYARLWNRQSGGFIDE